MSTGSRNASPAVHAPLSVTFPQATPASIFPPPASDYYELDDLLTDEEKNLRHKIRELVVEEVAPIMTEYWDKAEFPHHINYSQNLVPWASPEDQLRVMAVKEVLPLQVHCALAYAEIARVDPSIGSSILVHSCLATLTIAQRGSEEQKQKYIPSLARMDTIATCGLTEPNYGNDASSLQTRATKVEGGWIINEQKRWTANCTFADIFVISARNAETKQVNGFIIKKGAPGVSITKIENKVALRIVQNGDVMLNDVFVPDEDKLPGITSFQGFVESCLSCKVTLDTEKATLNRHYLWLASWYPGCMSIGVAMGVYDLCNRYVKERKQFGVPLAAFQLTQEKLVRMLGNIQAMFLTGWRLCKLHESSKMTAGHASMGKTVALGRELLGGNGILTDFLVGKAFGDMEPIFSYEGTYEINCLITGREITGIASFKPPLRTNLSCL